MECTFCSSDAIEGLVMCHRHRRVYKAAPDLLAACKAVVARWERGDLAEAARMCASAIAKADGRPV